MKALILAAGLGSRLKEETRNLPKALVQVSGKPILAYQLEALMSNNIYDIVIVLGKKGELIKEFVAETYPNIRVTYVKNSDYESTDSSYSFWLAREHVLDDQYIHLNCDIIFSSYVLSQMIRSEYENIIAVRTDINLDGRMEYVALNGDVICKMSISKFDNAIGKAFGLAKLGKKSVNKITSRLQYYIDNGDKKQNFYGMIREEVESDHYHAINCNDLLLLEVNTLSDLHAATRAMR